MNYNFYASKKDKIKILEFIFNEMELSAYDLTSEYEKKICKYRSVDEITAKFDSEIGCDFDLPFQLWSPRHKGNPIFRKIDLNPKYCDGKTFRYTTEGWGMIQLYFGVLENNKLSQSHIGHFTEKKALMNEPTNLTNGKVSVWDWKEIQITSRKLQYQIHNKMAVKKIGNLGTLEGAKELERDGIIFR